jgi:hypothetical protein
MTKSPHPLGPFVVKDGYVPPQAGSDPKLATYTLPFAIVGAVNLAKYPSESLDESSLLHNLFKEDASYAKSPPFTVACSALSVSGLVAHIIAVWLSVTESESIPPGMLALPGLPGGAASLL